MEFNREQQQAMEHKAVSYTHLDVYKRQVQGGSDHGYV